MPILAPLEAHKDKLLVLNGVHMYSTVEDELGTTGALKPGGPHMKGPGAMLTGGSLLAGSFTGSGGPAGWADRQSVDQYIAGRIGTTRSFRRSSSACASKGKSRCASSRTAAPISRTPRSTIRSRCTRASSRTRTCPTTS